jgi:hypothetical protein
MFGAVLMMREQRPVMPPAADKAKIERAVSRLNSLPGATFDRSPVIDDANDNHPQLPIR